MQVLIVENEIYLAQSIAAKLSDIGYHCEIAATLNEAIRDARFDVVLLSTNISGQNFYPIIEHYKDSIIILMISYVSSDTVAGPIKAGAKDYILKPFMMDELLRKIDHYRQFEKLKSQNGALNGYMEYLFKDLSPIEQKNIRLPLVVCSSQQRLCDQLAFHVAKTQKKQLEFIRLDRPNWQEKLTVASRSSLLYCVEYQSMKKNDRQPFWAQLKGYLSIISTNDPNELYPYEILELKGESRGYDGGEIVSIDEYIKQIVCANQERYPDTELSKKLGMSRKSLWEERKKFGIEKKK